MTAPLPATAAEVKACCTALYESAWARLLLGDSLHPGGLALTERLGRLLGVDERSHVLDVACGRGASAVHLARVFGCRVTGVDLSAANIAAARTAAVAAGVAHRAEFRVGDAERLPAATAAFDAVICECAFCTFPDKPAAAGELARVLRPGGRLGLSDLTRRGPLPTELDSLLGWIACLADARSVEDYAAYLRGAGFGAPAVEPHDDALRTLVRRIRARMLGVELLVKLGKLALPAGDIDQAKRIGRAAAAAIDERRLGYAILVAVRA